MNKIYRIIWSKTKNCWIVVSEIAKRHGKTAARKGGTAVLGGLVAASLLAGMAVCRPVWADADTHDFGKNSTITYNQYYDLDSQPDPQTPKNMMVWGAANKVNGQEATAWGVYTEAFGSHATAWGNTTKALDGNATAFGIWTEAVENEATAFGFGTYASGKSATAWGRNGVNLTVTDDKKIGARGFASTSFGINTDASGSAATAFGNTTQAGGDRATAFGSGTEASGADATAFGNATKAGGDQATAFGSGTEASGADATAFGNATKAGGDQATAFGESTEASGAQATAFGKSSYAYGKQSTAFGLGAVAGVLKDDGTPDENYGLAATAFGKSTKAIGAQATAFGESTEASGTHATAFGKSTKAIGAQATAFGESTEASGTHATAFGRRSYAYGNLSTAFGWLSVAGVLKDDGTPDENYGVGATAFGIHSEAYANNSLAALGGKVDKTAESSAAIGYGASVTLPDTVALGSGSVANVAKEQVGYDPLNAHDASTDNNAWKSTHNAIAVGTSDGSVTRQIVGVAAGTKDTDAVNVAQLKALADSFDVGGGFGLTPDDTSKSVTQDLGKTIGVIGDTTYSIDGTKLEDGNIKTSVSKDKDGNAAIKVELAKDLKIENITTNNITTNEIQMGDTHITQKDGDVFIDNSKIITGTDQLLHVQGDEGATKQINRKYDETLNVKGGAEGTLTDGNIGVTSDGTDTLTVKLAQNINLGANGSVTMGDTKVDNDGLTITDGPSVTKTGGINAGGKKITNVAAGEISSTSTDAVNGSQLNNVITGGFGLTPDDTSKSVKQNLGSTIGVIGDTEYGENGAETKAGNIKTSVSKDKDGNAAIKVELAKNIDLGTNGSVTMGNTKVDDSGLSITNGPTITNNGIDMGKDANNKITNLADGTIADGSKDAINGGQLWKYIHEDDDAALTFAGNSGSVKRNLGETMTIKGTGEGNDSDYSADNIRTIVKNNELIVSLKKDLNVDSVTAGKDGKGGVTIKGEDGVGTIGLKGNDNIAVDITVQNGNAGLNGEKLPRIVYTDNNGSHQVATLDDGMKYGGDSGDVIAKKLNEQLDIKGGANKDALTNNNIGVISSGGVLNVKLAKDLQGLNSVNTANLTVPTDNGKNVVINNNGIDAGGNYITNVKAGVKDTDAVNYGQLKGALGDYTLKGDSGSATKKQTDNLTIRGEGINTDDQYSGVNVKTFVDNGELVVKLDKNMVTETVTTNEITTENVITNEITIKGEKGEDGKDANAVVYTKIGEPGLKGGDGITRIFYKDADGNEHQVATFDDGMKYGGDFGGGASVKLNRTVNVMGEAKNKEDLTDGNIGVIAEQDGENGKLTVKLNKDIDLGANGSLTIGDTQLNNNGLTITNGPSVTNTGIDAGKKKITNVAAGVNDTDAVNYKQLKDFVNTDWKWELQADGSTVKEVKPNAGEQTGNNVVNFVAGDNVTIVPNTDSTTNASSITISAKNDNVYTTGVKLSEANDLIFTRNDGATYEVDLSSLVDGGGGGGETSTQDLRLVGAGDNLEGEYEVDKDHNLILNIADPKDKASLRTVKVKNLATMDEGLTFAGNTDKVTKKLGETITIKGEGKTTDDSTGEEIEYSGENVRTEVDKDGNLIVKLSKSLNANKIVVGPKGDQGEQGEKGEIGLIGPKGEDGKNAEAYISTDIGNPGLKGGDGITRLFYKDADGNEHQVATFDDGMKYGGDSGDVIAKYLNLQLDIKGGANKDALTDNNIGVISSGGVLNVKLAKDINLGSDGSLNIGNALLNNAGLTITNGPSVTNTGIDAGGKKITNVAEGEISAGSKEAVNGGQLNTVKNDVTTINETVNAGWELQTNGVKLKDVTPTNKVVNIKAGDNVTVSGSGNDVKISASDTKISKVYKTNYGQTVTIQQTNGKGDPEEFSFDLVDNPNPFVNEGDYRLISPENDHTKAYEVDENHTLSLEVSNGTHKNVVKIANLATWSDLEPLIDPTTGEAKGLTFEADKGNPSEKKPGDRIAVKGDGNVNTAMDEEGNLQLSLSDKITTDTIVVGPAGADGKDGVTIYAKDGKDGKEGHIGLTGPKGADGKDATADISVQDGRPGLNGKDGITRIMYVDEDGQPHEVATFDDGLMFGGDTGTPVAKKLNEQLDIKGGVTDEDKLIDGNIGVVAKNGVLNVKLAKDLQGLNSVNTANLTVPTDNGKNVVINNNGIDAGSNKITNVAAGTNDSDAVNFSQIKGLVGEDGHTPLGMTFAGNTGSVTKKPGETVTIKGEGAEIDKDGKKIEYSGENVRTEVDEDGNVIVKLNKNMTATTITTNEITINGANVTVKDGKDGLNGETVTRIIYKDPEGNEHQAATFDDGLKFKGDDGVEVAKNLNETLSIIGGADKDNLSDGNIGVVSDGEGGLNVKLAKDLKGLNSVEAGGTVLGNQGGLEDNKKNAVPEGSYLTGLGNRDWNTDDPTFVKGRAATEDQLAAVSKSLTDMTSAESGGGFGLTAEDGQSVKKDLGATVDVIGDGKNISTKVADGKVMVAMSDSIDLGQAVIGRDGKDGKDGVYIGDGAIQGKDGADGKDGISVRGADGKDGVTIYMDGSEGHIGLTGPKGADGKDATADISVQDGKPGLNGTDGITRIMYVDEDNQPHEVATFDDGLMFGGDTGTPVAKKLNEQLDIKGGITDTTKLSDNNIGVVSDGEGTLNVKLAKDLQGLDSIETKNLNVTEKITADDIETNTLTVNERLTAKEIGADRMTVKDTLQIGEGANPVTINNDGMDMGGRSITNVAPGKVSPDSTDAVNGAQLYQTQQAINQNAQNIQGLGNQVNRLSDRVDKVGAGAAALAGLHPLDFDPDAKWDVTAGYGHYRGENAAAVGAFYRPDENTLFSVASTVGNGDNMISAGVSMKINGRNRMNDSRTAMGKQILEMRKEMEDLRGLIADQAAGRQLDLSKLQLFPDTPENHWAYDYVATLAGNGLLEGYPDGEFKGQRNLTRYEIAAILYRAMTNGAQLTERALREFAPELSRIRVDTITRHSDGTPGIQRVRVIKGRK